jgi:hypothetical protein
VLGEPIVSEAGPAPSSPLNQGERSQGNRRLCLTWRWSLGQSPVQREDPYFCALGVIGPVSDTPPRPNCAVHRCDTGSGMRRSNPLKHCSST